jgi:NodT family efflux transporter outer membrane factor (OMF) lipoprotein
MPQGFIASPGSSKTAGTTANKINEAVVDPAKWWEALKDPELDSLVGRAVKGNPDIEIALDRMQEARMEEAVVLGTALPEMEAGAGGGIGSGSDLSRGRASYPLVSADRTEKTGQITNVAGFDAAWELDLFGKYRRRLEAAKYDSQAALAARNAVLISVIADVARAYVDLRAFQMQLAVLEKNMKTSRDYLDLTRERFERGITNELDVTLAQRELSTLAAQKEPLVAQIHAAQYVIAVLLGKFPEDFGDELEKTAMIPELPEKIDAGLPLDLLRRRPDIREAEREVGSATARIGAATADLFPHVWLTGGAGIQVSASPNIASAIGSFGPALSWALLDFGTLDALVNIADLRGKEALASYKQTVLGAVREVDTSIESYAAQQDELKNLDAAVEAALRAVSLANQRYDRGLTDSLNVIDAERQEYALEAQYVSSRQAAAEQFIVLYKALGGGWEEYQSFPPLRKPRPAVLAAFERLLSPDDSPRSPGE